MARLLAARPGFLSWTPPFGRLSRPLTGGRAFALPRRATPKRIAVALAALALLGGGWLWLRVSPLVSVEHVQISGVQGVEAGPIEVALRAAARRMTTLDVNVGALRAAVAPFRVVGGLSVSTSLPHGLHINVVEQLPVAELSAGGVHTAAAADGVVLGSDLLAGVHTPLPSIAGAGPPAPTGGRVRDGMVRAELSVLGAAPRALLGWVARVFEGREGLTVTMRGGGLEIYFGDATRPHAKWLAAARVLADPSSAGATYVDVRAPERPATGTAAGGLESAAAPTQGGSPEATAGASGSATTAAAVARALAEAVSGAPGAAAATGQAATGQAATGQAATGQTATGQAATGQTATGQGSTVGQGAAGQSAAGQGGSGQGASEQAAPAQGTGESSAGGSNVGGSSAGEPGAAEPAAVGSG